MTFFCIAMILWQAGSEGWDEKNERGWKKRMDDWKLQQGNLGHNDINDPDMAAYVFY